jgi:hypothetical protein
MLREIQIHPGFDREGTQHSTGSRWFDGNRVRWRKGKPEKIGGWMKFVTDSFKGIARSLLDWVTAAGSEYIGIGTNLKFYVESDGDYYDITPIRLTTGAGDVTFAATSGSASLVVTETAHGAAAGDFVTFSGAISLGGTIIATVLNQEYQIDSITAANTFVISAKDTNGDPVLANGSDTGDGLGATVAAYQITTGQNTYSLSLGWGIGGWGVPAWGGGGTLAFSGQLRLYSQDVFGDDLLFNPRGGQVYYWDESSGTGVRGIPLSSLGTASDTPVACLQVMVSPIDRHVIAFGVNPLGSSTIDPLLVRWSSQEDAGNWTPTTTNTSGGQVLSSGNEIVGAVRTRQEILIFTDTSVHAMRYAGAPFIFQFSPVGEKVSIIGPKAAVSVGDVVYFMDRGGFYVYQGSLQPLLCTVLDYVHSLIDFDQGFKVHAAHNIDFSEVTWFFQALGSNDISNYVTYNYQEDAWCYGEMARGAWIQAPSRDYPIASSADIANPDTNYLYNHEFGYDDETSAMGEHIESGALDIEDGYQFMFVSRILPDFRIDGETSNANLTVKLKGRDFTRDTFVERASKTVGASTQQLHVRARNREFALRIEGSGTGYGWTMGGIRFDIRTDGRR